MITRLLAAFAIVGILLIILVGLLQSEHRGVKEKRDSFGQPSSIWQFNVLLNAGHSPRGRTLLFLLLLGVIAEASLAYTLVTAL